MIDINLDEIVPVDLETGTVSGAGVPITDGINPINLGLSQDASFACNDDGLLYGTLYNAGSLHAEFGSLNPATGVFTLIEQYDHQVCAFSISCFQVPVNIPDIPTLSQWGLFIFALVFFTLGFVVVYNRKLAFADGMSTVTIPSKFQLPFDQQLFRKSIGHGLGLGDHTVRLG